MIGGTSEEEEARGRDEEFEEAGGAGEESARAVESEVILVLGGGRGGVYCHWLLSWSTVFLALRWAGHALRFLVYFFWSCWRKAGGKGGVYAGVGFNRWGLCLGWIV